MKGSLMPKGYHHLTQEQRCQKYGLMRSRMSQKNIALELGVSQSTISRELSRNLGKRGYRFKQADTMAKKRRHSASAVARKMLPKTIALIEQMLTLDQLSPDQISGRLKLTHAISISYETIYKHIWKDKANGGGLYKHLRRHAKKYNKRAGKTAGRGLIPNRRDIDDRPKIVDAKKRIGDFEGDTIIGAQHSGAILTVVDRVSKISFFNLLKSTKADETAAAIIARLSPLRDVIHTITTDNGKEFAKHEEVAQKLGAQFFFAHPYHSWERGLNENTNGLVRQYFPKKTNFATITQQQVLEVEIKLNNRPRKSLGYKTPVEEFFRLTGIQLNYALHS